jgi:diacylglycerol kinase (ATP)
MFSRRRAGLASKKRCSQHTSGYHPLRKLRIVLTGLYLAVLSDFSVAYKLVVSVPVLLFSFRFQQWVDVTLILLATGIMLSAELFNSAIEDLCDVVEPQHDARIGAIKDIAAAAAGISIFVWGVILILEGSHLWHIQKV